MPDVATIHDTCWQLPGSSQPGSRSVGHPQMLLPEPHLSNSSNVARCAANECWSVISTAAKELSTRMISKRLPGQRLPDISAAFIAAAMSCMEPQLQVLEQVLLCLSVMVRASSALTPWLSVLRWG
jgi:hypothetical protein